MINPYQCIVDYEGDDWEQYLTNICLFDVFKDLLAEFPVKKDFRGVVLFIAWGYSPESDMLQTTGLTWELLSSKIFERTGLDKKYYDAIAGLENNVVRECIERWMIFHSNEHFRQYCVYRDMREQFLKASLIPLSNSKPKTKKAKEAAVDEGVDLHKLKSSVEAKMLCATKSAELLKMMNDIKEKFIQSHPKLRSSVNQLNIVNDNRSTRTTEQMMSVDG